MNRFLEIFGLFSIIIIIIILITLLFLWVITWLFIKQDPISINCSGEMTRDSPNKYIYTLPLPIPNGEYSKEVARALLEIDLAVTETNCPNTLIALPPGFNYMQIIYGVNPMSGNKTMYAIYFYSQTAKVGLISFTGTALYSEWIQDLKFEQTKPLGIHNVDQFNTSALVHTGFYQIYISVKQEIHELLRENIHEQIIISGHSLGGALSCLCTLDIFDPNETNGIVQLMHYSFAAPRVGNSSFANTFDTLLMNNSYRIFNTEDVVPTLPPAIINSYVYEQTLENICFTKNLGSLEKNHTKSYIEYLA